MAKILPPGPKNIMFNGKVVGQYISTGDPELDLPIARAKLRELGLEHPELPLWMHIRQQAIYFHQTCGLIRQAEVNRPPPHRPFALIPYTVNTALCIELYLKALSLKHGKPLHGHELLELYIDLPPEATSDIIASIPDALKHAPIDGEPNVREFMAAMNDVFVKWRYVYEHEDLPFVRMDILKFLPTLMYYACLNNVPKSSP